MLQVKMKIALNFLFSTQVRFRELDRATHQQCSLNCSDLWGHLPDSKNLPDMSIFVLRQSSGDEAESIRTNKTSVRFFMGVSYDFDLEKWVNDFDKSDFNSSLWAIRR